MKFICPCCSYRTLTSRYETDTCFLCLWEDDLVSEKNPDEVVGGPNGDYSLTEARNNFMKYLIMYRPTDPRFPQSTHEIKLKKEIMNDFELINQISSSADELSQIKNGLVLKIQKLREIQKSEVT